MDTEQGMNLSVTIERTSGKVQVYASVRYAEWGGDSKQLQFQHDGGRNVSVCRENIKAAYFTSPAGATVATCPGLVSGLRGARDGFKSGELGVNAAS